MTLIERLLAQANKESNELADLLNEAAQALAQPQQEPVDISALVEGMEVSIDVSTGDHDCRRRLFGCVNLVQETQGTKHGLILLVQDPKANFKKDSPPAREPLTHGDLDLCRQWFGCIQDTNPSYIGRNDCALAAKLYTRLGLPIPKELQGVSANGIKETK